MTAFKEFAPSDPLPAKYWIDSWLFVLRPLDGGRTRLIVRSRRVFDDSFGSFVIWRVFTEPAHFVMERKMLLGIKERAERLGRERMKAG